MKTTIILGFAVGLLTTACAHQAPITQHSLVPTPSSYHQTGIASWYGPGFHGRKTANGERYNQNALTCAHRKLPFGTQIKVTNLDNQESVIVRVNDRGPFYGGRVIDLSLAAANALQFKQAGTAKVRIDIVKDDPTGAVMPDLYAVSDSDPD